MAYIYPYAYHYRLDFNELLRRNLAQHDVVYDVLYCADPKLAAPRGDLAAPEWARPVDCSFFRIGKFELRYQHAFWAALGYDLVILQQENGLLLNYPLQLVFKLLGKKTAFFGHGRNFQARDQNSRAERFKRFWASKVDWWFAYTARSADVVAAAGFPREKITVFNNAIDISAIGKALSGVCEADRLALRGELVEGSGNVGVYVGGLYEQKRVAFLLEAARAIRRRVPDFHLLIIGGGADADLVRWAAAEHQWIHYVGPKFGHEKSMMVSLGKVFLMPGLVGLAVLDSFAYGTPMVTTELSYHSPEIDYIKDGINGLVVKDSDSVEAYAEAVTRVLVDEDYRQRLVRGGAEALETYTVEAMAQRFADGVLQAFKL